MKNLEKVEGLSKEEYLKKSFRNAEEFAYKDEDDDTQRNRKDTLKMIYSPERFIMSKMFHTKDLHTLLDPEQIDKFVRESLNGSLPLYWETEKIPKKKYSLKVVGEDFDKRIFENKKDSLVLIYHPIKEKNRGI